jgi:hypothetical protein
VYVEQIAPYAAWAESVTALIIFGLNWLLIPRNAADIKSKSNLLLIIVVYAISLFIGTAHILWQYTYLFSIGILAINVLGGFSFGIVLVYTFALNWAVQLVVCPALLRAVTPRLKYWGVYSGTFIEWRSRRKKSI